MVWSKSWSRAHRLWVCCNQRVGWAPAKILDAVVRIASRVWGYT